MGVNRSFCAAGKTCNSYVDFGALSMKLCLFDVC